MSRAILTHDERDAMRDRFTSQHCENPTPFADAFRDPKKAKGETMAMKLQEAKRYAENVEPSDVLDGRTNERAALLAVFHAAGPTVQRRALREVLNQADAIRRAGHPAHGHYGYRLQEVAALAKLLETSGTSVEGL